MLEVTPVTLLLMTKLAAGSSVVFLMIRWIRYHPVVQSRFIMAKFRSRMNIHVDSILPPFDRESEESFLTRWFSGPPLGPVLLAGPVGSGRSFMIKNVLSRRSMTIYVDFRREPIVTGEEFLETLVANAGYVLPQSTDFIKLFTREDSRKSPRITSQEAEKALRSITVALNVFKDRNWSDGVPLICLDDLNVSMHVRGNSRDANTGDLDYYWTKFIEWTIYVSDAKLAHIVFVPSHGFEFDTPLYEHRGFRTKRILLFSDYPDVGRVRDYISSTLAKHDNSLQRSIDPEQQEHVIDWIASGFGGQMDDVMQILHAMIRGDDYTVVVSRMITDSVLYIEKRLELILSDNAGRDAGPNAREETYRRYLRLWSAMEMLRDNASVNRRDFIHRIFTENTGELDRYVEWGLIAFTNIRTDMAGGWEDHTIANAIFSRGGSPVYIKPKRISRRVRGVGPDTAAGLERRINSARHMFNFRQRIARLRRWGYGLSEFQEIEGHEDEATRASHKTQDAAGETTPPSQQRPPPKSTSSVDYRERTIRLLCASYDGIHVSAGSPRIRIAFDLILRNKTLSDQREFMATHLRKIQVDRRLAQAEQAKTAAFAERQAIALEIDRLMSSLPVLRAEFGEEFVQSKKNRLVAQEASTNKLLAKTERDFEELTTEGQEIENIFNALKERCGETK